MAEPALSLIDVAVIEPALATVRDALTQLGIRKIHSFSDPAGVTEALAAQPPDLIVIDVESPGIDGFRLIRWLRTDAASFNPFVCIIATSWQPTEALLKKVHNSGADSLLVKPASPKQMQDRLLSLLESRRRFTVSADYIGPDRRKNPRDGAPIPTLDAPNTLRLKTGGHWDKTGARDLIARGVLWLNEQRVQRDAFQIAFYVEVARPGLAAAPPDRLALDLILKISALVEDLLKRSAGRIHDPRLETACRTLLVLVERIRRSPEAGVAAAGITQLQAQSLELMGVVAPARPAEAIAQEIAGAASGYRKRLDQILAARADTAKPAP
ncbi:MAG: response regulator [Rhodospirillaceae bacterium]